MTDPRDSELGETRPSSRPTGSAGDTPAEAELLPLEAAGRYVASAGQGELGRGGMGRVLQLHDTHLRRDVAVKELLPQHTAESSSLGPLLASLFIREARVLARLEHPGVVPVYELGRRPDGTPYYSMRRIAGRSLAAALERCSSLGDRLALLPHFIDVVQTMAYAHSRGVVHRDLKPGNVMVGPFGETQVLDWGLASVQGEPDLSNGSGTPSYMSPEQVRSGGGDPRSDVWALGVMLFELLTGQLPFVDVTREGVLAAIVDRPTPDVLALERKAPRALVDVAAKALAKNPEARFANAEEMAAALTQFDAQARGASLRSPRPTPVMVLVAACLALAAFIAVTWVTHARGVDQQVVAALLATNDAQHEHAKSLALSALGAFRAHDTGVALERAQHALQLDQDQPLARGVAMMARELGGPATNWVTGVSAGCSSVLVAASAQVVACATLGGVELYGLEDGRLQASLGTGPTGWQHAVVALSHDRIASGGDDRTLHVWSLGERKQVRPVEVFDTGIVSLASTGSVVLVGLRDGQVVEVGAEGRRRVRWAMPGPVTAVSAVDDVLVAAGADVVRAQFGSAPPLELKGRGRAVQAKAHSALVALERSVVELKADGTSTVLVTADRDDVTSLVETGADRLVTANEAGVVQWWRNGRLEGQLSDDADTRLVALAVNPERPTQVVVAPRGRRLELVDWAPPPAPLGETPTPTVQAYWSRGWLVSGLLDGRVRKLDLGTREETYFEVKHGGPVRALAEVTGVEAPQAWRHLLGGDDGQVLGQRWNGEVATLDTGRPVTAVAASFDGTHAAWAFEDGTLVVWSLEFGKEVSRERVGLVHALSFSPVGETLAVGREDRRVDLIDGTTGHASGSFGPTDAPVVALAWAPDGRSLFSGGVDGQVTQWHVGPSGDPRRWPTARGPVTSLHVSFDGQRLAGASEGRVFVWGLGSGALEAELPADLGRQALVHFIDDGHLFAVGSSRVPHRYDLP